MCLRFVFLWVSACLRAVSRSNAEGGKQLLHTYQPQSHKYTSGKQAAKSSYSSDTDCTDHHKDTSADGMSVIMGTGERRCGMYFIQEIDLSCEIMLNQMSSVLHDRLYTDVNMSPLELCFSVCHRLFITSLLTQLGCVYLLQPRHNCCVNLC